MYHSSAILSAHLESSTLPLRYVDRAFLPHPYVDVAAVVLEGLKEPVMI